MSVFAILSHKLQCLLFWCSRCLCLSVRAIRYVFSHTPFCRASVSPLFSFIDDTLSSLVIQQSPKILLITPQTPETHVECYHGDTNYPYMYWYQYKSAGGRRALDLIGWLHYEKQNLEKNFEARFNITGHAKKKAQLVISNINPADTAEYFCAAS